MKYDPVINKIKMCV